MDLVQKGQFMTRRMYADRHRGEAVGYKAGDLVLLSTRDLKWQMVGQRSEKLTE